jgi:hypothetical protein
MWWGLVLGGIWAIAMVFIINILPPPKPLDHDEMTAPHLIWRLLS